MILFLAAIIGAGVWQVRSIFSAQEEIVRSPIVSTTTPTPTPTPIKLPTIPAVHTIAGGTHSFQTFNNCGPAALSMALSYFGITKTQQELGRELRPYQNPQGDNDDKSVTLEELAKKGEELGLIAYHRPAGDMEIVRQFVAGDIPVITRTWLRSGEDIGHYRVVKGYDQNAGTILQDDSLQGKNLTYSFLDFNTLWEGFNFEYLVLVQPEKQKLAEQILGENLNEQVAWQKAVKNAQSVLSRNPNNIFAEFNLSVAYFYLGDYEKSVKSFEKVENKLPFRTLWYQIEPILAYQKLGNYPRVFAIIDKVLNNYNRAFSELYLIRAEIYRIQGNVEASQAEIEKAIFYNQNIKLPGSLN